MPLTKRTPLSAQPYGDINNSGFLPSAQYSGSGSVALLPLATGRFDTTGIINFGSRQIFFYRFAISKQITASGIVLAFTANTALSRTLTSITESSGTATGTFASHGFSAGDRIRISGATPTLYNNTFVILTVPTANTFTFAIASGTGSASGTILAREFIGAAIYDSDPANMFPKNKMADVAIIPSTSAVSTSFDSNITLSAGTYYVGLGGSRFANNTSLATIVMAPESSTLANTYLFGIKTGDFSQYRGGIAITSFDNASSYVSVGNSGFPSIMSAGSYANGVNGLQVESSASSGNSWASKIAMVGIILT